MVKFTINKMDLYYIKYSIIIYFIFKKFLWTICNDGMFSVDKYK